MTNAETSPQAVSLTVEQALQQAIAHHQAGQGQDAERFYRAILQSQPNHPDANHNLGVLAVQAKQPMAALPHFKVALEANPSQVQYWVSYIEALIQTDQINVGRQALAQGRQFGLDDEAARALLGRLEALSGGEPNPREIATLVALFTERRYAEAAFLAGSMTVQFPLYGIGWNAFGLASKKCGRNADALAAMQKAAELLPNDAEARNELGNTLNDLGRLEEAEASYRRAVLLKADFGEAHSNLGITLQELGRLVEAEASYRRALEIKPDIAETHSNLGNTLKDLGRLEEAEASYRRALEINPDIAATHTNLGNALKDSGRLVEAEASYRRALRINPDYAKAHNNLGNTLHDLGRPVEAEASYRRALEIKPDYAKAHSNLGNALYDLGRLEEAEASHRRALQIKADFAEVHGNLGNTLRDLGRLEEAEACYLRALEIQPDFSQAYGNLLYLYAFTRKNSPESECGLAANWENISLNESDRIVARSRALSSDGSFPPVSRTGRKLRIGVVSAEISQHPVAEFLEPLLEQLDRSRFHVTLFPTSPRQDSRTARFRNFADEFKSLTGIPDKKAADAIRLDRIDILIDTTAYMKGCRLGIFAHRAAPVQCHYIGYHGTTGLTEMDWFIADEVLLPAACDAHFREGIWRLPRLWVSYGGDRSLPESRWTPGLDGSVCLGSFNNLAKVREETLALWAKVMNAIPESRLFLKDKSSVSCGSQERIRMALSRHGVSGERIEIAGHVPDWRGHMALYDKLDIALDTIPLNSGTTAFDALWMGVPLVALEGSWMGGRMSSTILEALRKPEWVARSEDEYVAIVAALARDVEGRKSLRAAQRTLMADSPLCDVEGLTRALEDAFEEMFDRWWRARAAIR